MTLINDKLSDPKMYYVYKTGVEPTLNDEGQFACCPSEGPSRAHRLLTADGRLIKLADATEAEIAAGQIVLKNWQPSTAEHNAGMQDHVDGKCKILLGAELRTMIETE